MNIVDIDAIAKASHSFGENNDCAVRAVTVVSGESYATIHELMAKNGRRPRAGTDQMITFKVLRELGLSVGKIYNSDNHGRDSRGFIPGSLWALKSLRTKHIAEQPQHFSQFGKVLISQPGHIAGMVDGVIYDWSKDRMKQVLNAYQITRL